MTIIIDENICINIELLQYEVESRKNIITMFLQTGSDINNEMFKEYEKAYTKCFMEYEKAKQDMASKYKVPENVNWNLDFATRELTY